MIRAFGVSAIVAATSVAGAQTVTITGKVTDSSNVPLGGAQVVLTEIGVGATTNVSGNYTILVSPERARGQRTTLLARFIGFTPVRKSVILSPGSHTVDFTLARDPLRLGEVVVTGTAEATETKKLAFAVGVVASDQIKEVPSVTALGSIAGKVAGVQVLQGNGEPGSAPAVRLRASTSLTGRQDPLVIVDGTITNATLADLNALDIERIEVVKGAAASSLYGSNAANGVVQIFTRRGANNAEGQTSVLVRNEYGQSRVPKIIERTRAHAWQINADGTYKCSNPGATQERCTRIPEPDGIADNPYPRYFNQQEDALRNGDFFTTYLSVGQKRGNTNFNASVENTVQQGILLELDGYKRQNFRINVDHGLTDRFDLQAGMFYGKSNNDRATQGPGSPFFSLTFVEPDIDIFAKNPDGSPYRALIPNRVANAANPLYNLANEDIGTDRSRFTGSLKGRWRFTDWLVGEANFNYDQENDVLKQSQAFGYLDPNGVATDGFLFQEQINGRSYNTGATLTSIRSFGDWLQNTTKIAYLYEDQQQNTFNLLANKFTIKKVPEFTAVDRLQLTPFSREETIRARNSYIISTFDIKEKLVLDGLYRRDESSLFGADERSRDFYRLSAAYRLSEDFKLPGIQEIKLRASRGTAGLRPVFAAQYETYSLESGSPVKENLGNRELKPAFSTEDEFGFNVDFLQRFRFEYTYSNKVTEDQILLVPLSAATGYEAQWRNAGTLEGKTHEMALNAVIAQAGDLFWQINLAGDKVKQRITELNVAPFLTGPGAGETAVFRLAAGQKFGVMYGTRVVRRIDDLYVDPAKQALSGPGQAWSRDSVLVNEEGYVVRRGTWRTINERPIAFIDANGKQTVEIGDVTPDFTLNINSTMSWKGLGVTALVNWVQGGNIYNGTRQWPFFENRDIIYDQRHKPAEERKPQQYYNFFYNSIDPIDFFVEDGSYVKLRELAVQYTLPLRIANRLPIGPFNNIKFGVVGRNLWVSTDYTGYDPEVTGLAGDPFGFRFDTFSYPNFRTFSFSLELGY